MEIKNLVIDLSYDPFDPQKNFDTAVEYERINQTASAVSFYLRAAEYGHDKSPLITYAALLKLSHCFDKQKDRTATVSNCILQAISYIPNRPEGYFLLSRFYEQIGSWQECYSMADVGLMFVDQDLYPLPVDVGYPGDYGFDFEKAVSGWWLGRKDESVKLFSDLITNDNVAEVYKDSARSNLKIIL
jgi:hypothetical protein